ncbi:ABC transporter permease [Clostridium sp.]|uniref:ABC transporter permease n=1 Tax=Clostridium sp. TaxID=1506 RepID=UPI003D6D5E25
MLIRNFFRDIISTLPRFLAVIIVTALGVMIYVGMSGNGYNLTKTAESYYKSQNVADYWIYGSMLTKLDEKRIANLDSVESIQSELSLQAESYQDEDITIDLDGISGDFNINKPDILSGRMFENNRECMLDASYAKTHNINISDKIDLKIKKTDKKLTFTVCALINSPEYIHNIGDTDITPDSYKHGFAFVKEDALEEMKDLLSYNKMSLILKNNTDKNQFRKDIEKILGTKLNKLLSFKDNEKVSIIINQVDNTKALTNSLPMIFFLIAALIMFTTMSRIVENSRMVIGTLKALGYSKIVIFIYFLSYAFIVVILGNLLGILPSRIITAGLMSFTTADMTVAKFSNSFDYSSIYKTLLITTVISVGTAAFLSAREIRYSPTECMRPKSPKIGKANFLEKIKIIWSNMNFEQKTITRNIFRNKMRLIMCVFGVAGSMAIIITAFGFRNSTEKLKSNMFSNMYRYDIQIILKKDTSTFEAERIKKISGVDKTENVMNQVVKVSNSGKSENTTINVMEDTISLMVPSIDAKDGMSMPEDGLIISTTLAKKLNIYKGDMLDLVVSGKRDIRKIKVADIKENITGGYISRSLWRKLGEGYTPSIIYVKTKQPSSFIENTNNYDFIGSIKQKSELVASINDQMRAVNSISLVLMVFGGVLTLVVLYNLGILNFYERMRELATLKVLGFYDKEIKVLVLRENTIFTVIGIIIGIPLGIALTTFILSQSSRENMTFEPYIKGVTFLYAAGLTYIFSVIVNLLLKRKLKDIDMLGALKSVE